MRTYKNIAKRQINKENTNDKKSKTKKMFKMIEQLIHIKQHIGTQTERHIHLRTKDREETAAPSFTDGTACHQTLPPVTINAGTSFNHSGTRYKIVKVFSKHPKCHHRPNPVFRKSPLPVAKAYRSGQITKFSGHVKTIWLHRLRDRCYT